MTNQISIKKTHETMKDRLFEYIKSQYFGENDLLLDAADELLKEPGNLYQKPYIESTPSYTKLDEGIKKSNLDDKTKQFFLELIQKKLGVFKVPFEHQVIALNSFVDGKNLFVATGTGSGKTECFMWPMIYKLIYEAIYSPETWKDKSVRAILIYPMNALVSDQISRLRSILGDEAGEFEGIFKKAASTDRRPQFGMYTGRTPYPGAESKKNENKKIAETYRNNYLIDKNLSEEEKEAKIKDIKGLKKIHKYPAKNILSFVEALEGDCIKNYDDTNDAELLLRLEMQKHTPDILITNYSMLEYMLVRKIESSIWEDTKKWLNKSENNKLLIVIDEAHMYSGSSGGEVALLIRRLLAKLGIGSKKVQFIMTSASMPNETEEDQNSIRKFCSDFSGKKPEEFEYIFGNKESMILKNKISTNVEKLAFLELEKNILTEKEINHNIEIFANNVFEEKIGDDDPQDWLYRNLPRYEPFVRLFNECMGKAIPYDELQEKTIGGSSEIDSKAFENLLVLAPLAKDVNGNVLFPARIHLFFRGLNGIYACSNPNCSETHSGDGIKTGALYTTKIDRCPKCGSKVYELINDRRCGALYYKGFRKKSDIDSFTFYFWNKEGIDDANEFTEDVLYIVPDDYDFKSIKRPKNAQKSFLDVSSGKVYGSKPNNGNFVTVLSLNTMKDEKFSFDICPKCEKKFSFMQLSDFSTKGNLPFFNVIKSQFDSQPMIKEPSKYLPNGGRKILLFSDSRQSAAVLARDMTKISDQDAFKKAIFLAMKEVYGNSSQEMIPLSKLYSVFVKVCAENKLRFFYGDDLESLESDKKRYLKIKENSIKRGRELKINRIINEFDKPCKMYQSDLIELFCSATINFHSIGLGYLVPLEEKMEDAIDEIGLDDFTDDEFEKIFLSFLCIAFSDSFAFDDKSDNDTRKSIKYKKGERYGFLKYDSYIHDAVKEKFPNDYKRIYDVIVEDFFRKEEDAYFLNLGSVGIKLNENSQSKYYRCRKCGNIHPFKIYDTCSICGSKKIDEYLLDNLKQLDYWRKPILSKEMVRSLNTEEHTAQLSFKDQTNDTWAKTEDYEMRFQDVNVEKEGTTPIDILSCTTTMEVGIDIGSLTAIGLRNVPPLRENYQQRAGRAGRRGTSLSTIITFAQNGPHDNYYFRQPNQIIKGKPRKPWIDVDNDKLIARHFNLVVMTKYFEKKKTSMDKCKVNEFKLMLDDFLMFLHDNNFSDEEVEFLFGGRNINIFKAELHNKIIDFVNTIEDDEKSSLFDKIYGYGILPTYSFPLDVVDFNITDEFGKKILSPQRSIDIAISEYAPGRTIVVDKKTYKSGGLYTDIRRKDCENFFAPAVPYFKEENGYYGSIYMCGDPACRWFGKSIPKDSKCPFCGKKLHVASSHKYIKPWGFAPLNAKPISEVEADAEMTHADEPCYSATPNDDLKITKYKRIQIANRKDEEIIILNKGMDDEGFDICQECGAAQIHNGKTLKENGVGAPFKTSKGDSVNCKHKHVAEGIFLGMDFRTDMFFMQIELDKNKITSNENVLRSAAITLKESMKLSASRVLGIEYNDIMIGTRVRKDDEKILIDIYFYDTLSSGAGYSTQIESNLDEILSATKEILESNDSRDICNFWNQNNQYFFNKNYAFDLLNWATKEELPQEYSSKETSLITSPLVSILKNDENIQCDIHDNMLTVDGRNYKIIHAIETEGINTISDYQVEYALPSLVS